MSSAVMAHLPQLGRPDAPRLPANGRGRSTRFATPSSLTAGGSFFGDRDLPSSALALGRHGCAFGIRTAMRNLEFVPVGACLWVPLPLPIRFCVKLTRRAVAAAHSCGQPNG